MESLTLLRLFVQVAENGSFSAVARATGTTPSAVSRQIARLEDDLGTRLVQRTTRQQVLTEAGQLYLNHARQIVEDVASARLAVSRFGSAPAGVLRVTAEADLAHSLLSPILPAFLTRYPDLTVQLHTSASLEDLIGRGMDIAVRMGHLDDSSLMARRLIRSRSVLVASPAFLRGQGAPKVPEDLAERSCLSFRVGTDRTVWRFKSGADTQEVGISGRLQANSLVLLRQAAKDGLGIAMVPIWLVQGDLQAERLVPVLPDHPLDPPETPISAVYPSGRNLAPKVRVFLDHLSAEIEGGRAERDPSPKVV